VEGQLSVVGGEHVPDLGTGNSSRGGSTEAQGPQGGGGGDRMWIHTDVETGLGLVELGADVVAQAGAGELGGGGAVEKVATVTIRIGDVPGLIKGEPGADVRDKITDVKGKILRGEDARAPVHKGDARLQSQVVGPLHNRAVGELAQGVGKNHRRGEVTVEGDSTKAGGGGQGTMTGGRHTVAILGHYLGVIIAKQLGTAIAVGH